MIKQQLVTCVVAGRTSNSVVLNYESVLQPLTYLQVFKAPFEPLNSQHPGSVLSLLEDLDRIGSITLFVPS